jgi:hypothetical protein
MVSEETFAFCPLLKRVLQDKPKTNVLDLFNDAKERKTYLKIAAPMVRYTK